MSSVESPPCLVLFYNLNNSRFNNYLLHPIILSVEILSAQHNYTLIIRGKGIVGKKYHIFCRVTLTSLLGMVHCPTQAHFHFKLLLKSNLSLACKLVQEVASFLLFFMFLKFHLKSLDLSLFLEGGWGSRNDHLVTL